MRRAAHARSRDAGFRPLVALIKRCLQSPPPLRVHDGHGLTERGEIPVAGMTTGRLIHVSDPSARRIRFRW